MADERDTFKGLRLLLAVCFVADCLRILRRRRAANDQTAKEGRSTKGSDTLNGHCRRHTARQKGFKTMSGDMGGLSFRRLTLQPALNASTDAAAPAVG